MERLKEIFEDPEKRRGKRVMLRVKILGRKYCSGPTFIKTRSDVTLSDGEYCVSADPLPMALRGKEAVIEATVEVKNNKIRLGNVKLIEVVG